MDNRLFKCQFVAMGGPCLINIWVGPDQTPEPIFTKLKAEITRLEDKFSRFKPSSLLSQINRGEHNGRPLDSETTGLLNYANQCFELSGHIFDPTIGILRQVWNYNVSNLPNTGELKRVLALIGWQKLHWDGQFLNLPQGMELDLGGVVKEFAVDRLAIILKEMSIIGLVDLAGDIAASGPPPNQKCWKVAVKHPRQQGAIAEIDLIQGGIAGSGDYERFIEVDGKRYCHVLRPDSGYPAKNCLASVTVVAESCLMAGTVSTVAMLKGAAGKDWLDEMNLPYLAVDQSLNVFGSIEVSK